MSAGPRISLDQALAAAEFVGKAWNLGEDSSYLVGSVRRRRGDVGDLEFLAPAMSPGTNGTRDALCERIQATMKTDNIFEVTQAPTIGYAIKGLKPGFLAASLVVTVVPGVAVLPVQVYRYTPDNLGWMLIERTGPREFGMWFLGKWKSAFGIPIGDEAWKASIDGHLVDRQGKVVRVPTEATAFDLAALGLVEPWERDKFCERLAARRSA